MLDFFEHACLFKVKQNSVVTPVWEKLFFSLKKLSLENVSVIFQYNTHEKALKNFGSFMKVEVMHYLLTQRNC